ncbi:MAG: hypothetical protein LBQ93_03965 [Treponema sp.]|jgi:hypothetical protein|nr:hypothetical protein [Treponema sp.]
MDNYAKLLHYKTYLKNPTVLNMDILKGEIYELYCYNYLLKNIKNVHMVKSKAINYKKYNGFYYAKGGRLFYTSCNIDLAEFDAIGITEDEIFLWEITKAKSPVGRRNEKKSFQRKSGLLHNLFVGMKINFKVIVPNKDLIYSDYENIIIEEPNYDKIISEYEKINRYKMDENFNNCYDINHLGNLCGKYNYCDEIIKYSKKLFLDDDHSDLKYLKDNGLIEYLYDIKNINKRFFKYYDIQKEIFGSIKLKGKRYFRDNKKIKGIKIKGIKNMFKKIGYFA